MTLLRAILRKSRRLFVEPDNTAEFSDLIDLTYQTVLGRSADPEGLAMQVNRMKAGATFAEVFVEIAKSDEAVRRSSIAYQNHELRAPSSGTLVATIIRAAYKQILRRSADEQGLEFWTGQLRNGLAIEEFFRVVSGSDEAKSLPTGPRLGALESDGEFLVSAGALLCGRGLLPQEVTHWQSLISEGSDARDDFAFNMLNAHLSAKRSAEVADKLYDPDYCYYIMGTSVALTMKGWNERGKKLLEGRKEERIQRQRSSRRATAKQPGSYRVSMIASLYKGRRFIEKFLDNITSQTIFCESELIIIDADSPDREHEVIETYQRKFPNIVYRRVNYHIGIYEAWNFGVDLARGKYLTNTNLDDLRRQDSIELQASVLDANGDVDVVYQDFFYSLDPDLSFEEVVEYGFKSELPIITSHNLLAFNSPHNAPMWRANLHDELGKFDIRYRSAGDWEFWCRCLTRGKRFRKLNEPHVAYYRNPAGASTRPDTHGPEEQADILRRYSAKLIHPALLQSRANFRASLRLSTPGDVPLDDTASYYDLTQEALLRLGASKWSTDNLAAQQLGARAVGAMSA